MGVRSHFFLLQQVCEKEKNINSVDKVGHWYILFPEALIFHNCKLDNITKNVVGKIYPALEFLAVLSIMRPVTWREKIHFCCGWEQLDYTLCTTL